MFLRYRNLDVRERMAWNIVDCRVEFESSKCEVYIRWEKEYCDGGGVVLYIYHPSQC